MKKASIPYGDENLYYIKWNHLIWATVLFRAPCPFLWPGLIKGKLIKKVMAVEPVCPAGYKKK